MRIRPVNHPDLQVGGGGRTLDPHADPRRVCRGRERVGQALHVGVAIIGVGDFQGFAGLGRRAVEIEGGVIRALPVGLQRRFVRIAVEIRDTVRVRDFGGLQEADIVDRQRIGTAAGRDHQLLDAAQGFHGPHRSPSGNSGPTGIVKRQQDFIVPGLQVHRVHKPIFGAVVIPHLDGYVIDGRSTVDVQLETDRIGRSGTEIDCSVNIVPSRVSKGHRLATVGQERGRAAIGSRPGSLKGRRIRISFKIVYKIRIGIRRCGKHTHAGEKERQSQEYAQGLFQHS